MIDFDAWRRDYDQLTYDQHVEFYRQVAETYPDQEHYNEPAIRAFLDTASGPVLELGGWKGELAARILPDSPIPRWVNVEIAPQAVTESACDDPRYEVVVLDRFLWDSDFDLTSFRTFIASHSIEHIKKADLIRLMGRLTMIEHLYIDAPLPEGRTAQWGGGNGQHSHILELGWDALHDLIESYGFHRTDSLAGKWGPAYWYAR